MHCRVLVPQRGMRIGIEVQCLNQWIAREVPFCYIFTTTFPATEIVIFWGIMFSWVEKEQPIPLQGPSLITWCSVR